MNYFSGGGRLADKTSNYVRVQNLLKFFKTIKELHSWEQAYKCAFGGGGGLTNVHSAGGMGWGGRVFFGGSGKHAW